MNCFQIIIFVTSETTRRGNRHRQDELWIAFKLLSLWRQKQRDFMPPTCAICCELLSNYYLCDVRNNTKPCSGAWYLVVNCFQIIIFVTSETTHFGQRYYLFKLWIAFKLLSLWRQKQRKAEFLRRSRSCELLSNYYLCDVRNNFEEQ